jgi:hypothetical protein
MLSSKIRTSIVALIAALGIAGVSLVPTDGSHQPRVGHLGR